METQISFSNQEKYPRQGFMQRNALSVKIILIGVLILILLIPLAMIRGLISERSETASEATTEVQNKWSSSQLVTGPFISIPCYENYEETYYENGATKIRVKKVKNYIHILPELLDITGNVETEELYHPGTFRNHHFARRHSASACDLESGDFRSSGNQRTNNCRLG